MATKWARRNLPRITQETLDHAAALITVVDIPGADPEVQHPSPTKGREAGVSRQTQAVQTTQTQAQQSADTEHETRQVETEVLVQTDHSGEPTKLTVQPPQPQRVPRAPRGCIVPEDSVLMDIEIPKDFSAPVQGTPTPVHHGGPAGATGEAEGSHQETAVQIHRGADSQEDESMLDMSTMQTSTPIRGGCRVNQHIRTDRKMIDWDLVVEKKWLIIGDSNLSRLPEYVVPDLQVDSYPGANFRHAQALIEKSRSRVVVEKVVLSFSLNSRDQKAKETAVKQMQAALRAGKRKFPAAEIWIPVINFSTQLSHREQDTSPTPSPLPPFSSV